MSLRRTLGPWIWVALVSFAACEPDQEGAPSSLSPAPDFPSILDDLGDSKDPTGAGGTPDGSGGGGGTGGGNGSATGGASASGGSSNPGGAAGAGMGGLGGGSLGGAAGAPSR